MNNKSNGYHPSPIWDPPSCHHNPPPPANNKTHTAIARNVVGKKPQKTAQANPERYFG